MLSVFQILLEARYYSEHLPVETYVLVPLFVPQRISRVAVYRYVAGVQRARLPAF